jgi:hypothetical protein
MKIIKLIKMKKIVIVFCIGVLLASCKDFLEEKPYDFISPENLQTSPVGIRQMVTGMYSVFFNAQMFRNESWIYLTLCDDEWTNGVEWVMSTYGVGNFKGGWIYNNSGNDPYYVFYRIIVAANHVLEALPNVSFEAADRGIKEQYEGEALTLRALAYFYLVQMYGPVPLHLRSDDPTAMARSSVKDVYNQIVADLHVAERKLYVDSKRPSSIKRGHITKGAAQLLLAKAYNTMGSGSLTDADITVPITITRLADGQIVRNEKVISKNKVDGYDFNPMVAYDSAKSVAIRLMETREYEMSSFSDTWNPAKNGGNEFIFALETDSIFPEYTTSFNKVITPVGLKGQGWLHYTKDLYYLYDLSDERGKYGIAHAFQSGNQINGTWLLQFFPPEDSLYWQEEQTTIPKGYYLTDLNSNKCFLMKWYVGDSKNPKVTLDASEGSITTNPTQNFPLLRYTEAYLILAEAETELNGPTTVAFDALDVVRSYRYNIDNYEIERSMTKQQLRSYIQDERTREFIGEGYRRFDMIRWGIYLQVMNEVDSRRPNLNNQNQIISKKRERKHLLHPVPTIEIDGNTAFGANNFGW